MDLDWDAISSVATTAALVVAAAVFVVQLMDRRRARDYEDRTQAEQVAGWLTVDRRENAWTAHIHNGSTQPVYDVLYVIRTDDDFDAALPEFIPLVPPATTWCWTPKFFDGSSHYNSRVYMTYRDGRDLVWQRDTHGRLSRFKRSVDTAPPADPITGRIRWDDDGEERPGYIGSRRDPQSGRFQIYRVSLRPRSADIADRAEQEQPESGATVPGEDPGSESAQAASNG